MSFMCDRDVIAEDDTVILHLGANIMQTIQTKKNATYQTKWGCLKHNDLIGQEFGSKIKCPKGYIYAMKPTPELWTVNLPHRTQILYCTDISMVITQLDLKPGSIVVESGTGSGSLSHSIIRTIAPTGHLYTYEFHEQRSLTAREEFKQHGLSDYVTANHRDVIQNGFDLPHKADAVFLDLPNPHSAIQHAKDALKLEGGRLCSFSPCMEQVQRVCVKLSELGFVEVVTMECLLRKFDVRTLKMSSPNMGDMDPVTYVSEGTPGTLNSGVKDEMITFKSGVPQTTQPGHTGYLTFATLYAQELKED